jgi:MarR family transcriptional regulator, 2-MHQ and catechol-resistance regulon repressor
MTTPLAAEELVVAVGQMVWRRHRARLREHGLSATAWSVLRELAQSRVSGVPVGEIARRVQMAPSTITAVADQLAVQGLVIRVRPPNNRRVLKASLTRAGREMIVLVRDGFTADGTSQVLDETEREQLAALLNRLTQQTPSPPPVPISLRKKHTPRKEERFTSRSGSQGGAVSGHHAQP